MSGEDRRLAGGRRLQRHAEMFELPARTGPGVTQPARARSRHEAQEQSPKLVSGRESAGRLLGSGPRLSSYRAHLNELLTARGAPAGLERRSGESLAPPRTESSRPESRTKGHRPPDRVAGRPPTL